MYGSDISDAMGNKQHESGLSELASLLRSGNSDIPVSLVKTGQPVSLVKADKSDIPFEFKRNSDETVEAFLTRMNDKFRFTTGKVVYIGTDLDFWGSTRYIMADKYITDSDEAIAYVRSAVTRAYTNMLESDNLAVSTVGVSVSSLLEEVKLLREALNTYQRSESDITERFNAMQTRWDSLRNHTDKLVSGHHSTLAQIRDYAIKTHQDGTICKDGLNEFLRTFDLEEYETLVRVEFTITGSYLVESDDVHNARYDARNYLKVDFSGVDNIYGDEDPQDYTVSADADTCEE